MAWVPFLQHAPKKTQTLHFYTWWHCHVVMTYFLTKEQVLFKCEFYNFLQLSELLTIIYINIYINIHYTKSITVMCSLFLMQFLWCILKHLLIFATSGGFISMKYCIHDVVGCDCLHIKSILKSARLDLNHKLYHNIKLQKASWSCAVYPEFKDNVFQI